MNLTQTKIDYIITYQKWPLNLKEIWNRYFIMIGPISFIGIPLYFLTEAIVTNKHDPEFLKKGIPLLLGMLVLGVVAMVYFTNRINRERRFYTINIKHIQKDNITDYLNELGWSLINKNDKFIIAETGISWTSWGEVITIVFVDGEELLFNSRADDRHTQPFTFHKEKVNFDRFINKILAVNNHRR